MPELHLAIDVGATKLTAGVVDEAGTVVVRDRVPTPSRDVWGALTRLVSRVLAASPEPPIGCGVACGAPLVAATGSVSPLYIPSWRDFPLGRLLEEQTGLPVAVHTDAQAFTAGEAWVGAVAGATDVIGVVLGAGASAGIISGGRLVRGRLGNAGGIGHVVVEPNGRVCACGGEGCLDAYVATAAIEAETGRAAQRTPRAIMERTGTLVGRALVSVGAVVDLRVALIGGPLALSFGEVLFTGVRDELERRAGLGFVKGFTALPAALGNDAAVVGAAALARSQRAAATGDG